MTDRAVLLRQRTLRKDTLMRLTYVGSQSKANSDVDGAVVESQAAAGQWKCVQPVTAVW